MSTGAPSSPRTSTSSSLSLIVTLTLRPPGARAARVVVRDGHERRGDHQDQDGEGREQCGPQALDMDAGLLRLVHDTAPGPAVGVAEAQEGEAGGGQVRR